MKLAFSGFTYPLLKSLPIHAEPVLLINLSLTSSDLYSPTLGVPSSCVSDLDRAPNGLNFQAGDLFNVCLVMMEYYVGPGLVYPK